MSSTMRYLILAIVAGCLLAACDRSERGSENGVVLRFAVLGDAEPKPEPQFPHMEAAVRDVNALASNQRLDFVVGVGDIAHKGTPIQYENATQVLQRLELPFYPIMGNEEHGSTIERFLDYANRWNQGRAEIDSHRYVQDHEDVVMIYASPDFSRDFNDDGIAWMLEQIRAAAPKPVLLIVHGAQAGAYPENPDKGIKHPGFAEVVAQPNLTAVISGDLHMDMDRVTHSRQIGAVHYLHIPALERTKIPDETRHDPMFRVFTLLDSGEFRVDTYRVGEREPLAQHAYRFPLQQAEAARPAFRLRHDMDAALDADLGWAADQNVPATVRADAPFRLRMEAQSDAGARRYGLQYRRNHGDWLAVEAHDFPKPVRELELSFSAADEGRHPQGWRLATGAADAMTVATTEPQPTLKLQAADQDLIALYPPPWLLDDGFKLIAEYRLPASGNGQLGLVFGYLDPANYWRLLLDAANERVRVQRITDDSVQTLAERTVDLRFDHWFESEVQLDGSALEINFNDDALEFDITLDELPPVSELGLLVPADSHATVRRVMIEGEPSSPRVSIVTASNHEHGASTQDLLDGSSAPFVGGVGVSHESSTPMLDTSAGHVEIEWPLVIRRFGDAAAVNETGDLFQFRLTNDAGEPVDGAPIASVMLEVPEGHLGGTFVETPGRVGPFQADNGDFYFILEPAETDNLFMVVKSSDGGRSWREVGGSSRPATGDLESVDARLEGDTLHIIHQVTESVRYHAFHTADHTRTPDRWAITDELATKIAARAQMASLVVRSDGSLVAFHLGDTVGYNVRSPAGQWSDAMPLDAGGGNADLAGPQAVLGADDSVHVAYYRMDGSIWHRRLDADGSLTSPQRLADGLPTGEDHWGPVLPLVYLPATDTVVIGYRGADGHLHERRITGDKAPTSAVQISDRPVVQHAVDSQQTGADLVSDGTSLYALFIDAEHRNIYRAREVDGEWSQASLEVDDIDGGWVRGNLLRAADGARVYGYVYDAGSDGGSGMTRYRQWLLEKP